jgi:hypothetical protein
MGFSNLISNLIKTAKDVAESLLVEIEWEKYLGDDNTGNRAGKRDYDDPVKYKVALERKNRHVPHAELGETASKFNLQFLDPVEIDTQDRITLPSGDTPQILFIEGDADPDGKFYAPRVYF